MATDMPPDDVEKLLDIYRSTLEKITELARQPGLPTELQFALRDVQLKTQKTLDQLMRHRHDPTAPIDSGDILDETRDWDRLLERTFLPSHSRHELEENSRSVKQVVGRWPK
jgi:hypothetical protein